MKRSSLVLVGLSALVVIALITSVVRGPKPRVLQPPSSMASVPIPSMPTPAEIQMTGCSPKALTVLEPQPGAKVVTPVKVRVRIENRAQPKCHWTVFEAVAGSLALNDAQQATLGTGILMTTDDWMTDGPVEFSGSIPVAAPVTGSGQIVITEENPSGQHDSQTVSIPVNF